MECFSLLPLPPWQKLQHGSSDFGTKPEYLIIKISHEEEQVVVVVAKLKKPLEETEAGKEKVMAELVEYIEEQFNETKFSSIYSLRGIGLSQTAFWVDRTGSHQPHIIVPWWSNVTSSWVFNMLNAIVSDIHKMSTLQEVWPVASLCTSYADQLLSRMIWIHHNHRPRQLPPLASPHEIFFPSFLLPSSTHHQFAWILVSFILIAIVNLIFCVNKVSLSPVCLLSKNWLELKRQTLGSWSIPTIWVVELSFGCSHVALSKQSRAQLFA